MAAGLAGEMDGQCLPLQHDRANGAVEAIGKPVVRQRDVAAPQGDVRLDRAIAAGHLRPHIDLACRQQLAPLRRHRGWQQPFPVSPHHQPFGLEQQVEIRGVRPTGIATAATQERGAGVGLELLEPQPRAIDLKASRHIAHRGGERGMLEATRFQSARHREDGVLERCQRSRRLPVHADPSPQSGDPVPHAFRHLTRSVWEHADHTRRHLERLHRSAEVEHAGRNRHAASDARPLEEVTGSDGPHRGPSRVSLALVGLDIERELTYGHPRLPQHIVDEQRGVFDRHRHEQAATRSLLEEPGHGPTALGLPHGMHHGSAQPHCTDPRRPCDQIGEVRAARQTDLVDPEHLPTLFGQTRIDERHTADHDPFPFHEAGPLHLHGERGKLLRKTLLDAGTHLLAQTARTDGAGGHHAGHRDRQGPAHEHPERIGERFQGSGAHGATRRTLSLRPPLERKGRGKYVGGPPRVKTPSTYLAPGKNAIPPACGPLL